ncbi:MAG: carboxylesterase family protein, partial [Actinomycetota bacterium]|nr:carboxylesterase family protein [Actinomycetota bacterium]
ETVLAAQGLTPAAEIAAEYPPAEYASPGGALGAAMTDATFACPAFRLNSTLARYVPVWAYEFNDQNTPNPFAAVSFPMGAYHSGDLQYLMDITEFGYPNVTMTRPQERLARSMKDMWTDVAKTARPTDGRSRAKWPEFDSINQRILSLQTGNGGPQVITDFYADHNCSFWETRN